MSFRYIREQYKKDFRRGQRVLALGQPGTVTSAPAHYVRVKLDGQKISTPYHPNDVEAA